MSNSKVLISVPGDSCGNLKTLIEEEPDRILHLPLEIYKTAFHRDNSEVVTSSLDNLSFVIYGNLRNATHFLKWVHEHDLLRAFQNLVHLSMDKPTFMFLEKNGIPSIMPRENARPVDIMEFMFRISREGKTLYPTAKAKAEEMPGLLNEMQMDVLEFSVCREVSLSSDTLNVYKEKINNHEPGVVLFHNRSSVTRTNAAFPNLNLHTMTVLSGSAGVTQSLINLGIEPDFEADGNWLSIQNLLTDEVLKQASGH